MANLLNIVKTPTTKKVNFPKLSKDDAPGIIVRKFITYVANIRKYSNKKVTIRDIADVVEKVYGINAISVYQISDILSDKEGIGYDQAFIVSKFQTYFKKWTNAKEVSKLDNQALVKVELGGKTRYILVVDDAEVKVNFSKELVYYYLSCENSEVYYFAIVSYSALDLIANSDCELNISRVWIRSVAKHIMEQYEDCFAAVLNASYSSLSYKTIAGVESDKVYQDEKLNSNTTFLQLGFRKAEIDSEPYMGVKFNYKLFKKLETDWESICNLLPHSKKQPELKFRKLGKYKASGLYVPALNILAVDVRKTSSFVHEYGHYLDFTYSDGVISETSSIFKDIRRLYENNLSKLISNDIDSDDETKKIKATDAYKKIEYYITPTEIFARGFELWVHFAISDKTELTMSTDDYKTRLEYKAFEPFIELVLAFFNDYFEYFSDMQPLFTVDRKKTMVRVVSFKEVDPTNNGEQLSLF